MCARNSQGPLPVRMRCATRNFSGRSSTGSSGSDMLICVIPYTFSITPTGSVETLGCDRSWFSQNQCRICGWVVSVTQFGPPSLVCANPRKGPKRISPELVGIVWSVPLVTNTNLCLGGICGSTKSTKCGSMRWCTNIVRGSLLIFPYKQGRSNAQSHKAAIACGVIQQLLGNSPTLLGWIWLSE